MTDEHRAVPSSGWVEWPATPPPPPATGPVPGWGSPPAGATPPPPAGAMPPPPPVAVTGPYSTGPYSTGPYSTGPYPGGPYPGGPDGSVERPYPVGRRLGFGGSLTFGYRLARTSLRVLSQDRRCLLVPLAAVLVSVAVVVPYVQLLGGWSEWAEGGRVGVVRLFPLLLALSVVDVFAAAVVVGCATVRLAGGTPSLTDGWVQALARAPKLLRFAIAWAVQQTFSAWLRNRGRAGQVAADLLDTAWNVATFLAVPVLLHEPNLSVRQAVRRSAKLVGQRWGAGLVANTGLQLAVMVCGIPLMVCLALLGAVAGPGGAIAGFLAGFIATICVASALRGILSAALYRFATTGVVAPGFRDADLWNSFARPSGRR